MTTSGQRPHFERPPVIEVVCGVQFEGLDSWGTAHYGKFWSCVAPEYSEFQEQPPLAKIQLEPPSPKGLHFSPLPPLRRVFFIQPPGNFLLQVQPNRFLHNWRKVKDGDEYPRYDEAYERFRKYWEVFKCFLEESKLPPPQVDAFELTYINHIFADGASFPRDVWNFLGFYGRSPRARAAMEATSMQINFTWPLQRELGVLTMEVKHGHRTVDQGEVLLVELTARGKARGGEGEMGLWFEVAHDAIVNTFDDLTTETAHRLWGKRA